VGMEKQDRRTFAWPRKAVAMAPNWNYEFQCLRRTILLEPVLQLLPAVLGGLLVVRGSVIGMETMVRFGIHHDLARLVRVLGPFFPLRDGAQRDPAAFPAIEAQNRRFQVGDNVHGMLRV